MKKLIKIVMSFLMVFSMFFPVSAEEQTVVLSDACSAYELARVNDIGGFDSVACYSTFEEAKAAMTHDDDVVRHASSKSPTKIIAIKSGIAISYPRRNGSLTLDVYQREDFVTDKQKYKSTYVVQHRELQLPETVSYNGNGEGTVKVVLNGFEGYASLSGMDLVPMKFLTNGLNITLGGQTNDNGTPENPFDVILHQSYYSVVQNGNYKDLVYHTFSGYNGEHSSLTIGPAADWMTAGAVYYSCDGVNFYSDCTMTDFLASYYSYYLFLPLRSLSGISAETFDSYLSSKGYTQKPESTSINNLTEKQSQLFGEGHSFVEAQNVYGVNALMIYAMACLESGYGRSNYAVSKNNLFGWNAVDENPDNASSFSSIASGIQEHMAYNLRGYMDVYDVRYFGMHVGNKGSGFNVKYASDPYWGMKIASIAYEIDKFSRNYDGTLTDYQTLSLGLIDEFGASYFKAASSSSEVYFTSEYSSQYQKNHIVVVNGETNGFYQVQTPNAILPDGSVLKHKINNVVQDAAVYDFKRSTAYISMDSMTMLNEFNDVTIPGYEPSGEFVFELNEFILDESGILQVSGKAYLPGIYITDNNQLIHTLKVYDEYFESSSEVRMNTELLPESKDEASFSGSLDLNELEDGKYYFRFNSDYSSFEEYCDSRILIAEAENVETQSRVYTFVIEDEMLWVEVETKQILEIPENSRLVQMIDSFDYLEKTDIVRLNAIAYITGIDAASSDEIRHTIRIINMETDEVFDFDASSSSFEGGLELNDGFKYEKIMYQADLDMSTLPEGIYTIRVVVKNGEYEEMSGYLKDNSSSPVPELRSIGGHQVRFSKNSVSAYRYELAIEKNEIAFDELIDKPTRRNSRFELETLSLSENKLMMSGIAWMYNVNFNSETHPVHQIVLVDESGRKIEKKLNTVACSINYSDLFNSIFDWSNICFSSELDLSNLEKGIYRMYVDISSEGYRDITEAINIYHDDSIISYADQKSYQLITKKGKNRMILIVGDAQ